MNPYQYLKQKYRNIANSNIDDYLYSPIFIAKQLYKVVSQINSAAFFVKHFIGQLFIALAGNYILFQIRNDLMEKFGRADDYVFKVLGEQDATEKDWQEFQAVMTSTVFPILSFVAVSAITQYISTTYQNWFKRKLTDNLSKKIWQHQSSISLTNNPETSVNAKSLTADVEKISSKGTELVVDWGKKLQNFILSIGRLIDFSSTIQILWFRVPDLLAISFIYSLCTQYISSTLASRISKFKSNASTESNKQQSIEYDDHTHIKTIFSAGIQDHVMIRQREQRRLVDKIKDKANLWQTSYETWQNANFYLKMIYKNIVLGFKVFNKTLSSNSIYEAWSHFNNVDDFISWTEQKQEDIHNLTSVTQRATQVLNADKQVLKTPINIRFTEQDAPKLSLRNLKLRIAQDPFATDNQDRIEGATILNTTNKDFNMGRRYVISGPSGCGKSSLLAKINKSLYDGIDGEGVIVYPTLKGKQAKRILLTQDDYFPEYSTLLEILLLPPNIHELAPQERQAVMQKMHNTLNNPEQKKLFLDKTIELLKEAKIDSKDSSENSSQNSKKLTDRLEEPQPNWKAILSGGQRKKIKFVWAMIHEPDILLLDETFAGIDSTAIKIIQEMLVKYLPKSLIITVDHHPETNNNQIQVKGKIEGFYQEHCQIANCRLSKVVTQRETRHFTRRLQRESFSNEGLVTA